VRERVLRWLRCPACRAEAALELVVVERRDVHEVREGMVRCSDCGREFEVRDGTIDLLVEPPPHVQREAAGLERFAARMRDDGWDGERIRRLPEEPDGYWWGQNLAFHRMLARVPIRAGQRLVDVGSNTGWASNAFARCGLEVLALDIARGDLQGLGAAEHFLADGEVHFERVMSTMVDPAIASASVDYVFASQVLHHNAAPDLRRAFAQCHRVVRPGGVLMMSNEPLRFPLRLKRDHAADVAEFGGHEHVYFLHQYYLAARRAGFRVHVLGLDDVRASLRAPASALPDGVPLASMRRMLRRTRPGRAVCATRQAARFAWTYLLRGDAALALICARPDD
jgi:SAM-dependent methyltransferase